MNPLGIAACAFCLYETYRMLQIMDEKSKEDFLIGQLNMHKNRMAIASEKSNEFKEKFFQEYAPKGPLGKTETFDGRTITYSKAVEELKKVQDRIEAVQQYSVGFHLTRLITKESSLVREERRFSHFQVPQLNNE
jgi:hypothetical protein